MCGALTREECRQANYFLKEIKMHNVIGNNWVPQYVLHNTCKDCVREAEEEEEKRGTNLYIGKFMAKQEFRHVQMWEIVKANKEEIQLRSFNGREKTFKTEKVWGTYDEIIDIGQLANQLNVEHWAMLRTSEGRSRDHEIEIKIFGKKRLFRK